MVFMWLKELKYLCPSCFRITTVVSKAIVNVRTDAKRKLVGTCLPRRHPPSKLKKAIYACAVCEATITIEPKIVRKDVRRTKWMACPNPNCKSQGVLPIG